MFIHEAVQIALEIGACIVRRKYLRYHHIKPTDSDEGFILVGKEQAPCPRWQPKAEDLMADDWTVTMAETP